MPNTFTVQAQERFKKSSAFLAKAQGLLQDDLVARTVLADAVSAVKNMLQGYLLARVGALPLDATTQEWQEIAASNRMPDLLRAAADAGLRIRDLARDIRRLNDERNYRTHDDPQSRVNAAQARQALELARTVAQRINAALKEQPGATASATSAAVAVSRAPLLAPLSVERDAAHAAAVAASPASSALSPARPLPVSAQSPTTSAQASPVASAGTPIPEQAATDDEPAATEDDASADTNEMAALRVARGDASHPGRTGRLARALVAALLLVVLGGVAGGGLLIGAATHHAPGWMGFATQRLAPLVSGGAAATALPTATSPATSPAPTLVAGALAAGTPTCAGGTLLITLRNTGTAPLPWAVHNGGGSAATFRVSGLAGAGPAAVGTLAPGGVVTVAASGLQPGQRYAIEAFAPGGVIEILATAC